MRLLQFLEEPLAIRRMENTHGSTAKDFQSIAGDNERLF